MVRCKAAKTVSVSLWICLSLQTFITLIDVAFNMWTTHERDGLQLIGSAAAVEWIEAEFQVGTELLHAAVESLQRGMD